LYDIFHWELKHVSKNGLTLRDHFWLTPSPGFVHSWVNIKRLKILSFSGRGPNF